MLNASSLFIILSKLVLKDQPLKDHPIPFLDIQLFLLH